MSIDARLRGIATSIIYKEVSTMRLMERVPEFTKEHFSTSIGWMKKKFPTNVKGVEIQVGGIFSLIPKESLMFAVVGGASEFSRARMVAVIDDMMKKGWKPFVWKDDGVKDASGELRLFPFVRREFGLLGWLADEFGLHFEKVFNVDKAVKIAKYFTQPVDFTRARRVKVLVVPADLVKADGNGFSSMEVFDKSGKVVKVVGLGDGVVYKGTILQKTELSKVIPPEVIAEIEERNLGSFDVLATTDTVKFSEPWTVHDIDMFWHDGSNRNRHETVTISEQFIRVAPLTDEFKARFMKVLDARHVEIREAMANRGRKLGAFVKGAAMDQDFEPDDHSLNAIIGDVGDLMRIGVPFAFKNVQRNIMRGLQSFLRNRTVGCVKIPGIFAFVVSNERLNRGEIVVPNTMKKLGVSIGDAVTVWRSPISPTAVRMYEVVRFIGDNHLEMRFEDLNEFHQGDTDGDKLAVTPGALLTENRDRLDDAEIKSWSGTFAKVRESFEEDLPDTGGKFISALLNEIEVVVASKAIGMAERARAAIELKHGRKAWRIAYAFFQEVEQQLIDMKKHSGKKWSASDMVDSMIGKLIPVRPAFHRLLANKRIGANTSVTRMLNKPQLERSNHEFVDVYEKGVEMARDLFNGFQITGRDQVELDRFKTKIRGWLVRHIQASSNRSVIYREVVDSSLRTVGYLHGMRIRMATFYRKNSDRPDAGDLKRAFRESEINIFDKASPDIRKAIIGAILVNEIYAWLYHFDLKEVKAVIGEAYSR